MKKLINIYKPISATPLEVLDAFREEFPVYKSVKLAYAGRLDPMAHGVLLVLVGDACKSREKYQNLSKVYKFKVLLGVATDTYDILGLVNENYLQNKISNYEVDSSLITKFLDRYEGKIDQPYPPYSAKAVNGQKLFMWAKQDRLSEIAIPSKEVFIKKMDVIDQEFISGKKLLADIIKKVRDLSGDFRQEKIITCWEKYFLLNQGREFIVLNMEAEVSSGTYVRSIAQDLGIHLGRGAIAYDILRTRAGDHHLENSIKLN